MDPGRIDRMYSMYAVDDSRDDRPRQLVDDLAEARVLLWRPAHDGKGPDRVLAMINCLDVQNRERVPQAVIAQVIAERTFGQLLVRIDNAADAEIRSGEQRQPVFTLIDELDAPAAERSGEG